MNCQHIYKFGCTNQGRCTLCGQPHPKVPRYEIQPLYHYNDAVWGRDIRIELLRQYQAQASQVVATNY